MLTSLKIKNRKFLLILEWNLALNMKYDKKDLSPWKNVYEEKKLPFDRKIRKKLSYVI